MKYITFDPFYSVKQINEFMEQYKNNGFLYISDMLISIRPPYYRYIKVEDNQLPVFIKYKEASNMELMNSVHQVIPLYAKDEFLLQRRYNLDSESIISNFIEPSIFRQLRQKPYGVVFKWFDNHELQDITLKLKSKIYVLGVHRSSWKLAFSFDRGIKSFIAPEQVILEKLNMGDFSKPGEFEIKLNQLLVSDKLKNKVIEYPLWDNGRYIPLPRTIPKL